ncbi:hypothetical protein [Crocosphaera chwakensis]|uniref:Uncharacterized protein n=1 Tax=Crocosphaera chwakensis CCY0110 TaxID=391612 RepID=A3IV10_9CHRO|nr:hypothetical protein [Crocosphaera chwakensis]EAZ89664.1 hypothetical protein CY0110_11137 [Crocosphaera chwakensis CCY0110]
MKPVELFPFIKEQRQKLQENYQILWQEAEKIGKEYEQKSYREILSSPAKTVIINLYEDQQISCFIDAYHVEKNGTIAVCIDADGLPTLLGIKPSYHFYKRPDGSIDY